MKCKSTLVLMFTCLFLLGTAHARLFIGLPSSTLISTEGILEFVGVHVGTHDLGSGFGLRAGAEFSPSLEAGLFAQGGADVLYSTGEDIVFYVGAGGGYKSIAGADSLYVAGTAGVDLDAATTLSYFVEVQPRYDINQEVGLFYLRSGLNLHFGD